LITGHTAGIGLASFTLLKHIGYKVEGISRRTGHNLQSSYGDVKNYILSRDPDIFINNAYVEKNQTALLKDLYAEWKGLSKLIINIGSVSALIPSHSIDYTMTYAREKRAQREFCERVNFDYSKTGFKTVKCKLTNINFDYVQTDFPSKHDKTQYPNLLAEEAAQVVEYVAATYDKNICFREITAHSNKVI